MAPESSGEAALPAQTPAARLLRALESRPLASFAALAALLFAVYAPALRGPFVSDDFGYIVNNPYMQWISVDNLAAILDPWGEPRLFTTNYAPLHLLGHLLERLVFGNELAGFHAVNVLLHALNSLLLVRLLRASRVGPGAALFGGLFFALHPANVEAVAWISQLKSTGALALSLGALLLRTRRPLAATALFALGLLTKTSTAAALPMAVAFAWARRAGAREWAWNLAWGLVFALYAVPQLATFSDVASVEVAAFADPLVQLRTGAAVGARYLAMAATSHGVSAFQALPPVLSALDPWWLAALPAGALLAWRLLATLLRREEEAAFWIGAVAGFAPVSQIFPFLYPIGDRYLYFVLPGLIGGSLLALAALGARLRARPEARGAPPLARRALLVGLAALLVGFAARSHARAGLWQGEELLLRDAAAHYPEGDSAQLLAACEAAKRGDVEAAVAALRASERTGVPRFSGLDQGGGCFAALRAEPAFQAFLRESAARWLEEAGRRGVETQALLRAMARAHVLLGEDREAAELLKRALARGGPLDAEVRSELLEVNARRRERLARRAAAREAARAAQGAPPASP
jgi:hypothetical protein